MEIDRDGLYRHGTASQGMGWQIPRLPGLGEVRWDRFLSQLYRVGYDGVVSVEHEDRAFERTEALVKRGFLIARDASGRISTDARSASGARSGPSRAASSARAWDSAQSSTRRRPDALSEVEDERAEPRAGLPG